MQVTHARVWCSWSMWLIHFKESKKSWCQHGKSGIAHLNMNLTWRRERGALAPSVSHGSYCDRLKWGHLSPGISFCVRRPEERDRKRNENGVFTFFSIKPAYACKLTGSTGQFMPQHEKKKTASQDNSFPLWEIYDCIFVLALAAALPLQQTLGMFPTPHCGKWALLRGSVAPSAAQALRQDPRQHFAPEL